MMVACACFRWIAAGALVTAGVACSMPAGPPLVPPSQTEAVPRVAPARGATKHLYVIVTTSTQFVAEYPIRHGIPDSTPDRTVSGFTAPNALTVDSTGHLFVLDLKTIKEFAPGANGNAKPIREIRVPSFLNIDTLAVDKNGYAYVGQKGHVYVYAPGAHGRAKPVAVIKPDDYPSGLAIDSSGDLYALGSTEEQDPSQLSYQMHASVYSAAPQLQRIRAFCSYEEGHSGIDYGVALDGANHAFTTHTYFINSYPSGEIDIFPADAHTCPRGASGTITTTNPTLREPVYLAVDAPYLYVADVFYGYGGAVFTLRTSGSPQQPLSVLYLENNQPHNIFGIALGP
ncbi:MAG TPA: hypothetical protein VFE35_07780 [Candidatus Cybelea sp.]|jgi:hypothetical protein|nr:hypothetical protein [Candidatus Cybelea sp.]